MGIGLARLCGDYAGARIVRRAGSRGDHGHLIPNHCRHERLRARSGEANTSISRS
jgi:hypothetical protein